MSGCPSRQLGLAPSSRGPTTREIIATSCLLQDLGIRSGPYFLLFFWVVVVIAVVVGVGGDCAAVSLMRSIE